MAEWINVSGSMDDKSIAVNVERAARIEIEPGDGRAIIHMGVDRVLGDKKGVTWFEVTDPHQVRALREHVNRHILRDAQHNATRFV
jgi:hypothetical protein